MTMLRRGVPIPVIVSAPPVIASVSEAIQKYEAHNLGQIMLGMDGRKPILAVTLLAMTGCEQQPETK
jgi:hypothetical protein